MKKLSSKKVFAALCSVAIGLLLATTTQAQVKIGTNPNTIDPASILELESTTMGFLLPRLTTAQRDAIPSPPMGLMIFNTEEKCVQANVGTAATPDWQCLTGGSGTTPPTTATVTVACDQSGAEGTYIEGVALTTAEKYTVTLRNNSFAAANVAFATSDIVISGASGVTVSGVAPASSNIPSGGSIQVTYTLTGTPAGGAQLQFDWTKVSLTCSQSVPVTKGDATLALPVSPTIISGTNPDIQGTIDNATNQLTVTIPYTNGRGAYDAYTSAPVAVTGEGGDSNNLTISYPAGTLSTSGNLTATVTVDGDGSFLVKKLAQGATELIANLPILLNGANKGNVTLTAMGRPKMAIEYVADYNIGTTSGVFTNSHANDQSGYYTWAQANAMTMPPGYHLPSQSEWAGIVPYTPPGVSYVAFTNTDSHNNISESITVNGVTKTYTADYRNMGNGTTYALRFKHATDKSQLAAYRYELVGNLVIGNLNSHLKVTVRYLGDGFTGDVSTIASTSYWNSNNGDDVVRVFPACGNENLEPPTIKFIGFRGEYWSATSFQNGAWAMWFHNNFTNASYALNPETPISVRPFSDN